ncbi:outer membrane protein OmpA-like peptidoglycan-associated protein [Hymenobacter luteus]|uniref:Outer membrane protein OmpA-like peptidoglycan-associated protein n=2 Tax=Hymenobacter TaxID=89966 RepID=A0A7W9WBD8_9BACT|nr:MULTISPECIES: OmpA family protein [Hymenobacter]MBB4600158.1 outer membrane protein OmpA-like peptidoglycan-associated protein [Hymenobacter latericoloratus]MBB6057532.1 outer membrane protein OmpA-like peptidoglycan-associated protein [Hymenobacter luteus]
MHIYLLAFLLLATTAASAQNVEFSKDRFGNDKEGLKTAQKEIKTGDEFYDLDPPRYEQALPHYLAAQKFNPNNAQLNLKIGDCYLHSGFKPRALEYLQKAYQLSPDVDPRIHYLLGRGLHLNAKWDEAIAEYKRATPAGGAKNTAGFTQDIQKKIRECENGRKLAAKPSRVFIDNAGPGVNSPYPEYGPVITADESVILFTSRRPASTGGQKDPETGGFFEDIYTSTRTTQGNWVDARNLGESVNTEGHDATVGLSPDGQRLLVYLEDNGGDLHEANLRGAEWRKPQRLGSRINSKAHESSAAYTPDGRSLYFVTDKEGGLGGRDIYRIEMEGRGPAVNLGSVINTQYGEEGVFLHPDGKTMYFSSEGHNSMGGYDIFKSVYQNGRWSAPENLGWPINTPDDDVFFVISASGRHGYYSSFRDDGLGSKDIYQITFLGPEKPPLLSQEDQLLASRVQPVKETLLAPPVAIASAQVTILKGVVTEEASKQPTEATIDVIDNSLNQIIASFQSNAQSGRYLVSLPSGVNYGIVVRKDGYLFHSENFDLPAGAAYSEVVKNIALKKLDVGVKVVLNNIFFDTGKATLRKESTGELERLQKLLAETPALRLEISGHTDNVGKAEFNKDLSQRRAQAVVDYLVTKGIDKARLTSFGYADTQPVATNTTATGRQLNRRTEFKVTGK